MFLYFSDFCQTNYLNICVTDLNQICRFGRTLAVDLELFFDSSIDVPMANNFCLFNPHIFLVSDQYVTNFVHSATTRSTVVGVIDQVDRRRVLFITPMQRATVNEFLPVQSTGLGSRVTGYG